MACIVFNWEPHWGFIGLRGLPDKQTKMFKAARFLMDSLLLALASDPWFTRSSNVWRIRSLWLFDLKGCVMIFHKDNLEPMGSLVNGLKEIILKMEASVIRSDLLLFKCIHKRDIFLIMT